MEFTSPAEAEAEAEAEAVFSASPPPPPPLPLPPRQAQEPESPQLLLSLEQPLKLVGRTLQRECYMPLHAATAAAAASRMQKVQATAAGAAAALRVEAVEAEAMGVEAVETSTMQLLDWGDDADALGVAGPETELCSNESAEAVDEAEGCFATAFM